jgi:hypothetical protein
MAIRYTRNRVKVIILALASVAAIAAGSASVAFASPGRSSAPAAATVRDPVVINCAGHAQTRPGSYTLACADGNAYVSGLHWAAWGSAAAFGSGTYWFNDCVPSCVAGHGHSFTVLTALWRAKPLPGHPGERYFTRLTLIFTASHSYRAGGRVHHLPGTQTLPLSAGGGA